MIIAFTGHRPNKIGGYDKNNPLAKKIKEAIKEYLSYLAHKDEDPTGNFTCISGMALGVDQLAAEVCIEEDIPFIAAVPFLGQESVWPLESQEHYNYLLEKAEEVVIVSEGDYAAHKMQVRNEYMVNKCDALMAVYDGSPGGTQNCVNYAKSKGKPVYILNPKTL